MKMLAPSTVDELVALKSQFETGAVLVAGATDLGVKLRRGLSWPDLALSTRCAESSHLRRLPAIAGSRDSDDLRLDAAGRLILGIRTTHRAVERVSGADPRLMGLADACRTVGSIQTRNVGTVIGNVVNASPAADSVPILSALGAQVTLERSGQLRRVSVADLATGPGRTVLEPDEVVTGIEISSPQGRSGSAFSKLGRRRVMEISIASVGTQVSLDAENAVIGATLCLGAVGPTCIVVPGVADALKGLRHGDPETQAAIAEVAAAAMAVAAPRDDHRASANYRGHMVGILVKRAMSSSWHRALGREVTHDRHR